MMREVVDHGDAARLRHHLLPPGDAAELGERACGGRPRDPDEVRDQQDAEAVAGIDGTGCPQHHLADLAAVLTNAEAGEPVVDQIGDAPGVALADAEELHVGRRARDDVEDVRKVATGHHRGRGRHQPEELAERCLHRVDVAIDVGVVELDCREQEHGRVVVEELGLLVEVGRIVLVALDHEPRPAADARAGGEVAGGAADQPAGVAAAALEHEGEHRARCGLAVRSRDHERAAALEELLLEGLRERDRAQPAVACGPRFGVVARDRVAAHDEVDLVESPRLPPP